MHSWLWAVHYSGSMKHENTLDNQTDYQTCNGAHIQNYGVRAWLFWLRQWLGIYCGLRPIARKQPRSNSVQALGRARRHSRAHFERCALPPARNLSAVRALLPRGLSPTQTLERLTKTSVLGRVCLYQIWNWGSVLVRRAALVCYDHGWWRAPQLCQRGGVFTKALRPP